VKSSSDPLGARRIYELVRVPALLTLLVTLLRLTGESLRWSERWFDAEAGGGGALVGITWLAPVFGGYFGWVLARAGRAPSSRGRAIFLSWLGLILAFAGARFQGQVLAKDVHLGLVYIWSVGLIGAAVAWWAWPALSRILLVYGLTARIPVVAIMFFAIWRGWGTHYDAVPPGFPEMGWFARFLWIGFFPQLLFWVSFTVVTGSAVGSVVGALSGRGERAARVQESG
jgi:hypothetical protein